MAELVDRRDLSEGLRWLAGGVLSCAVTPMLFSSVHPWVLLRSSAGGDAVVSWVIGLATVIIVGKAIEGSARLQYGAYLRSRLFLESIRRGVSRAARRKAGIGPWDVYVAWLQRLLFWTRVSPLCMRAAVPVLIEIASDITEATGIEGSLRINPLRSFVIFLGISQARTSDKSRGIEVECGRSLDRFLLFVTLGQAFALVALVGVCALVLSIHRGDAAAMRAQGVITAVAFLAAVIAKAASGQGLEEVLVYIGALLRGFAASVVSENAHLKLR